MTCAVVGQFLGGLNESLVVGREEEVFAAHRSASRPLLTAGIVVDRLQALVVQDVVLQDGVPIGRAQAVVAEMPVAALKADIDVHFAMEIQLMGDGVVLERMNAQMNYVNATQRLWHGVLHGFGRVKCVDRVGPGVFDKGRLGVVFRSAPC